MIEHVRMEVSDRKLRLFATAWLRQVWHALNDDRSRQAVEIAERHADGLASDAELDRACDAAGKVIQVFDSERRWTRTAFEAACAANWVAVEEAVEAADQQLLWKIADGQDQLQASLLRELLGNPFRPISIDPAYLSWHDGLIPTMAQRMYDRRDFSDMPVLADALEESGCQNQDILGHCRSGGEHVRGCWVVDALLGKE
jgi:hypothetical protein